MEGKKINGSMCRLPVEKIFPHPENPRKDLGDLSELAASIKARGVLQNLTVVPRVVDGQEVEDEYWAVIGNRRHAAAKLAGLAEVPCVIADMTPKEQFETMMIENVQRNDLTVYEQAKGFQMMLDMGDSVEDVAKKTGFSPSTIRRRAQLASLNEEKFKKTERRGASLEDYLKLSKIQDPARRDKVLETVGTAEFNNSYKKALNDEKAEAFFQELLKAVRSADWLEQKESHELQGEHEYIRSYGKNHQELPEEPEDAKPGRYVYVKYSDSITIYRKKGGKKGKSASQKLFDKLQEDLNEISEKLEQISQRHRELRSEFIRDFTSFSTYEMDIAAFAAKILATGIGSENAVDLGKLLGISTYVPKGEYKYALEKEPWQSLLFNQPQKALLCAAYTALDDKYKKYSTGIYDGRPQYRIPKWHKNKSLDLLYEGLKSLDYEMSEEEIQMQDGSHPLFKHAERLVEVYKEDLKDAKKKASKK